MIWDKGLRAPIFIFEKSVDGSSEESYDSPNKGAIRYSRENTKDNNHEMQKLVYRT